MNPRPFACLAGAFLLLVGVAGFAPSLVTEASSPLRQAAGVDHPRLLALLPVSPLLSVVQAVLGGWGIVAGRSLGAAVGYARKLAAVAAALLLCGMIPMFDTLFGAAPLYGNNLLLHGPLALLAFLFGWLYRRPTGRPAPVGRFPDNDEEED